MRELLGLIVWFIFTIAVGWSILSILSYKKRIFFFFERIAISYCLGAGLVSIEMVLLSIFRIKFSIGSIVAWWLGLFLLAIILDFKNPDVQFAKDAREKEKRLSPLEKFLVLGISFEALYTFFRALIKPVESYDSIAIYALKAKIFYLAKCIPQNFFTYFKDFIPHIEYPLLLPLAESSLYTFLGELNDQLVKVIFPLYYAAILTVFYFILRKNNLERRASLLFTFLLATIPQFKDYGTIGYSDMMLAFYCSASLFYLFLWMKEKEDRLLILSFILSALATWTKTEGLMLTGVNLAVMILYVLTDGRKSLKKGIYYVSTSLAMVAFYLYIKNIFGVAVHGDFSKTGRIDLVKSILNIKRIGLILYEYQIQFFGPKKWNIVWIIFILGFIAYFKKAFLKDLKFITVSVLFVFLGYGLIYMMLPEQNISWHLSTTASRFLIHFLPIVILWLAALFKETKMEI